MEINRDLLLGALTIVIGAGLTMLIPAALVSSRLWRAIRLRHAEVWRDLGEPRVAPMSIATSRRLRQFLRRKEYESLSDPEIASYAATLRILNWLVSTLFWTGVVLVVAAAATSGN